MEDNKQVNYYEQVQMEFAEAIEHLKAVERAWTMAVDDARTKNEELSHRINKAIEAQNQAIEHEKAIKKSRDEAERALERAKASEHTRNEMLRYMKEDEKKIKNEGGALERQRMDINECQKDISRRQKFLDVDEDRIDKKSLQVNKLIHANNLEHLVKPEEKRKELATT